MLSQRALSFVIQQRRIVCLLNTSKLFSTNLKPENIGESTNLESSGDVSKVRDGKVSKLVSDYAALSKFRLSSLVAFTTAAGFVSASYGMPFDWTTFGAVCAGTSLCASSASAFNQIFEKDHDAKMKRTCQRPLPSNRISLPTATKFGLSTGVLGTALLYAGTNPIVAALGLGNIFLYAGPYTFSKRFSAYNTWLGSVVGAIPPVMGAAAASGGVIMSPESIIMATLLLLWQFPHFFALAWMYRQDYASGGFRMVSTEDPSGMRTASVMTEYTWYLALLPVATTLTGYTSYMFGVEGVALNAYLLTLVYKFKSDRSNANARKVFLTTLWYLPLLLCGYLFYARHEDSLTDSLPSSVDLAMDRARAQLRQLCLHEAIVDYNKDAAATPQVLPAGSEASEAEPSPAGQSAGRVTSAASAAFGALAAQVCAKSASEQVLRASAAQALKAGQGLPGVVVATAEEEAAVSTEKESAATEEDRAAAQQGGKL